MASQGDSDYHLSGDTPGSRRANRRLVDAGLRGSRGLAGLPVQRVHAVVAAVLLHLDPLTVVVLVLGRDVVAVLADLALQGDLDPPLVLRHVGLLHSSPAGSTKIVLVVAAAGLEPATSRL